MERFGENLRKRARALGLSDAEVARRVGLNERRYGFYVTGDRQPDLATLVQIADVLNCTVDSLLRSTGKNSLTKREKLKERLASSAQALNDDDLEVLVAAAEGILRCRHAGCL